ncbi:Gfo/Idh/MocA family oxidoreductase, partial [bacterium]|nr:Gfo/Idh/MocA family oxidoreductase [bacterium]
MLNAGVIGVGSMGRNHARVYAELENVHLVAIADLNQPVVEQIARIYGTKAYTNYEEMLDKSNLDVVSVAVPTTLHAKVASDTISRGINTLVEKPLAVTIEDGQLLVDLAKNTDVKLTVGYIERFNPAIIELKKRLNNKELGKCFQIHSRRLSSFPARIRDVGVTLDLATHELDIMRYLIDSKITRLYAEIQQKIHDQHEDLISGVLRFENGVVGVLDVNWLTPTKIRDLTVVGENGMFLANYLTQDLYFYENASPQADLGRPAVWGIQEGNVIKLKVEKEEPLKAELSAFIEAVATDNAPLVSAEDGLEALM